MKKTGVAFALALGLLGHSLPAQAEGNDDQVNRLMQSMKTVDQQDGENDDIKSAELNLKFNKRFLAISREQGPKSRAAFKKAVLAWMAYQKAMSVAVETSYTEGGGRGGATAATHCNLMTGEDFLKVLDQFYGK